MTEKILCKTCYHSILKKEATYCNYYNKYMNRSECSKYDHDKYKWFKGSKKKGTTLNTNPKGLDIRDKRLKKKAKKRVEVKHEYIKKLKV